MGSGWENGVVVLVTLSASLSLLARARQGACPPGTTMWGNQSCNPAAAAFEVPTDALVACFLAVPIAQVTNLPSLYVAPPNLLDNLLVSI